MDTKSVTVHVTTIKNDRIQYTMQPDEWEALKDESRPQYYCTSCDVLADESVRPYSGAQCKCPNCRTRMDRVKSIIRDT